MDRLQTWLADRGIGQYPLPRSRPRPPKIDHFGLRLFAGFMGLIGTIVFGGFLLIFLFVVGVFIYAAFTGDQPPVQ